MGAIAMLGSEEQKRRWLPPMARMETLGAFGLTEPDHGSDAVALATRARRDGDAYVLDGAKKWIGNASFADVVIVWARDDAGQVGGFLVEKGAPGFTAEVITGKLAQRAVWQARITLDGVRVPAANRLAGANSFKDTAAVLTATRSGVAWEALGHAAACYEAALAYAQARQQFGKPLVAFQLIQNKLARMLAELTAMQLLCLRLSQLQAAGAMTAGMASLAKMNNAAKARQIAADARDILGGNGILLEHHVARHQADLEATFTYEGAELDPGADRRARDHRRLGLRAPSVGSGRAIDRFGHHSTHALTHAPPQIRPATPGKRGNRRRTVAEHPHRRAPRRQPLRQDRRRQPRRRRRLRRPSRPRLTRRLA